MQTRFRPLTRVLVNHTAISPAASLFRLIKRDCYGLEMPLKSALLKLNSNSAHLFTLPVTFSASAHPAAEDQSRSGTLSYFLGGSISPDRYTNSTPFAWQPLLE